MDKNKVVNLALSEQGYLEKSWGAYNADPSVIYEKSKGAGYDNITKYGYEMHKVYPQTMDFPAAWCDAFVDWCFYTAYGTATAKALIGGEFDDYTVASANQYKKMKAYYSGTDGIDVGDQIFFRNSERICHTGLVVKLGNGVFYTVEGNTSPQGKEQKVDPNGGGVYVKEYSYDYDRIDGYGRPPYDKIIKPEYPRWINFEGNWYYRIAKNKNAHGWNIINDHWYYFDTKGKMLKGIQDIESPEYGLEKYYLTESGDLEGALQITNARGALIVWDV